jgi:hypothetical protein
MMSVYFVVMTICSGMEGCVQERRPDVYATQEECVQELAALTPRKGLKFRCAKGPQLVVREDRKAAAKPHLISTAVNPAP